MSATVYPTVEQALLVTLALVTDREGVDPTEAALYVETWRRWPEVVGLAGYKREHPDTALMARALRGKRGLVGQMLAHVDAHTEQVGLTNAGHDLACKVGPRFVRSAKAGGA